MGGAGRGDGRAVILPDVNILVHTFRRDSSDHSLCRRCIEGVLESGARFGVSPLVLSGFLRVVTHPRVFAQPSALAESIGFCEALLAQPNCVLVEPGPVHWSLFTQLCRDADARGNLVPDAWFAALAIESACEWITLDRDFARFPGLRWRTPKASE